MQPFPDIEIYLAHCDITRLDAWLQQAIGAEPLCPAGKHKWRTLGHVAAGEVPVLVVEKAADGFASLWLDSAETPWATDLACAREAAARLGCEVRCSLGGWQPGDDPDRFLQVKADGHEQPIDWADSGK
ncbi:MULTISPECIES: hypothetical protein [Halomonas]|uniref:Uncharacterized protein n=1 Tax=Halomonas ventosae TaxID=229007 RepID=A0A4R6HE37_9GAMM|nr:hypothetical protein [Halomonas ventosae]TDO06131.1 hypothetical protein DFO68_11252 [Halomonas ventosae]